MKAGDVFKYNGIEFMLENRNAEVGELVIISKVTKWAGFQVGSVWECEKNNEFEDWSIDVISTDGEDYESFIDCEQEEYLVLTKRGQD